MRFVVDFDGSFTVDTEKLGIADTEDAAFTYVFNMLNYALSPICDREEDDDWEITNVQLEDE